MTHDFIEQLAEACQKEGCPYFLIVQAPDGQSCHVVSDLDEWKPVGHRSKAEDLKQLIDALET